MCFTIAPNEYVRRVFRLLDCYEQSSRKMRPPSTLERRHSMMKTIVVGVWFLLFRAKYYCKTKKYLLTIAG